MFASIYECFFPSFDWPGLVFRDLSDRLNLSRDEGEKWIVNLIRETRMGADAKIDLEKVRRVLSLVALFELSFDVIPNAQTLANHAHLRHPGFVPVWVWRQFGWVGGRRVQPLWISHVVHPRGPKRTRISALLSSLIV